MNPTDYDPPRRFARVRAPIHYRPARDTTERHPVIDVGLGGLRLVSSELREVGSMWDVEVLRPDGSGLTCTLKVIWIRRRPDHQPPDWEVGAEFVEVPREATEFFQKVLAEYS